MLNDSIKFTQELIRIPSVNPPGNEVRIATYIKEYLNSVGITSKFSGEKKRPNLIFTVGNNDKKSLLLNAHLDTVLVSGKWKVDPSVKELEDFLPHSLSVIIRDFRKVLLREISEKISIAQTRILKPKQRFVVTNSKIKSSFNEG